MSDLKIRINEVPSKEDLWEFDYTKDKKRVRKKISCSGLQAKKLGDLLNKTVNEGYDRAEAERLIDNNPSYADDKIFLLRELDNLYFDNISTEDLLIETQRTMMQSFLPIEDSDMVVHLLGKAGVGKSTIIQKISAYYEDGFEKNGLQIPFTDTSRTTTYTADYRFVPEKDSYRFFAILKPIDDVEVDIKECIDRGTTRYFEGRIQGENEEKLYVSVLRAFFRDPKNLFDIRYTVGQFYKTTDPEYMSGEGAPMIGVWEDIFGMIRGMCNEVLGVTFGDDLNFYNNKLSTAIRSNDPQYAEVKRSYEGIIRYIKHLIEKHESEIKRQYQSCPSFKDLMFDSDNSCIHGYITDINDKEVKAFLKTMTLKSAVQFGKSYLNRMSHLRIELPYNKNIFIPQKDFVFVMNDSVGIAHNKNETGGFEDSTNLRLDGVDAVLLVDDARLNGDNNFTSIFEHIISRVEAGKIFYAYTFYDDLNKEDLEDEDEKNEYLISNTRTAIEHSMQGNLFNAAKFELLTKRLNEDDTFFLSELKEAHSFTSLNKMLASLADYKLTNNGAVAYSVVDTSEPMVVYDYKKIPLIYQSAITEFYSSQESIYEKNPPHFKTTEALTRRLMFRQTYFDGARMLRPVDDFYDCLIKALSPYLDVPEKLNFRCDSEKNTKAVTDHVIGKIKTYVTEALRKEVNDKFLSESALIEWKDLYMLSGSGADWERRDGILNEEKQIGSNVEEYLRSSGSDHMINIIERELRAAIDKAADQSGIKNHKLFEIPNYRERIM